MKQIKYKYLHILWGSDLKFIGPLLEYISNNNDIFVEKEQYFITPYENVYNEIKKYNNVIYDNTSKNLYNKYGPYAKWIFSHSLKSSTDLFRINPKYLSKIIFRTWGGSFGYQNTGNLIKDIAGNVYYLLYRQRVKHLAAIGVANYVDEFDIRKYLKKIPLFVISYSNTNNYQILKRIKEKNVSNTNGNKINVLIGHRGTPENNHIAILNQILKQQKNNLELYIPLSYGDKNYITEVKDYINKNCNYEFIHIIDDFYDFEKYADFLSKMDVAIFDGNKSYALGNISILLFFGKTIYLNENSQIAGALRNKGVSFELISDLQNISKEPISQNLSNVKYFLPCDDEMLKSNWKLIFDYFN